MITMILQMQKLSNPNKYLIMKMNLQEQIISNKIKYLILIMKHLIWKMVMKISMKLNQINNQITMIIIIIKNIGKFFFQEKMAGTNFSKLQSWEKMNKMVFFSSIEGVQCKELKTGILKWHLICY